MVRFGQSWLWVSCLLDGTSAARVEVDSESETDYHPKVYAHGPTLPPIPHDDKFEISRLPIEFLVEDGAPALDDGDSRWFCVKIRLLPEDGGDKYAVLAKRRGSTGKQAYSLALTPEDRNGDSQVKDGSQYYQMELDPQTKVEQEAYPTEKAKTFILGQHGQEDEVCKRLGGIYTRYSELQRYVHDRMTKRTPGFKDPNAAPAEDRDILETHVKAWNKRWARVASPKGPPNGCKTQRECSGLHVSYVKIPDDLQRKFMDRLLSNWTLFYEEDGAGIAGTTGANFIGGNRGYRFPDWGKNIMDTLFPSRDDYQQFEDALSEVVMGRADIIEKFGAAINVDFQHRLWRYGPDFPHKGGLWHRDTCPFGIGGAVPEGGWQLTSVYVFYAKNMDLSTSGTRLKDRFGETHDMPCVPGTANVMRSGENDPYSPWHSGPRLQKINNSEPAYRVMLQSKMILRSADHQPPAGAEAWGGLGFQELPKVSAKKEKAALKQFFKEMSQAIAWGASESNAVGSEAYPVNATRAWARTEEMAKYFGFQGGFLPTFTTPPVDVVDENAPKLAAKPNDSPSPDDG